MQVFAIHERICRKVDGGETDGRSGSKRRRRGRAGVLLRGSVVKRIDPNHYDMSRLRFAASTMAGSSPESETLLVVVPIVCINGSKYISRSVSIHGLLLGNRH
ncbi:hypothetical protein X777_07154 [Ooceraea biroi]|uniref:Uncharacterized protein n=1 Tax=Ooceraea biroi TaxID=2015173 RepID=A0A026WA59_OOCBI|nr:hypothetical protein X777_07154 [Ooceraea biroi]